MKPLRIEAMQPSDWPTVAEIYRQGIETGVATFETEVPSWEDWSADHLEPCRLVARAGDDVVGWVALAPVSGRCVYGGVAEVSVYVARDAQRQGVGKKLLEAVIACSERHDMWTLQAGVMAGNPGSIALHEACGFRVVGTRERLGALRGVWHDVILLERRSPVVGAG